MENEIENMETQEEQDTDSQAQAQEPQKTGNKHLDLIAEAEHQLAKEPEEQPESKAKPETVKPETKEQKPENSDLDKLLASWADEDKKAYAALPKETQTLVSKYYKNMLTDYKKKTAEVAQTKSDYDTLAKTLEPVRGRFKTMGDFAGYVQNMLNFDNEFKRNPMRTMAILAQRSGLDLTELANFSFNPLEESILPLQQQIAQLQGSLTKQQPGAPKTEPEQKGDPLAEFVNATDESGNPKYPHFNRVAKHMGIIMERDGHEDVDKAYKEAVSFLPETREQAEKDKAAAEQKKQAELLKAKKANALKVTGSAGGGVLSGNKKTHLDLIAEADQTLSAT